MVKRIFACGLSVVMFFSQSGITFASSDLSGVQKEETFSDEEYAQATDEELSQLVHYGDVQSNDANQIENNGLVKNNAVSNETAFASDLKNPVHHCDTSNNGAYDYSDYSYIYFGSYPQWEVTDSSLTAKIDTALSKQGKVKGDVVVDGVKYRKIDESDCYHKREIKENLTITYRYFKWEPILWKVLHLEGNKAFLSSVLILDDYSYDVTGKSVTWETCSVRKWLNGYDGYGDNVRDKNFTGSPFITSAFTQEEQKAIFPTSVITNDSVEFGTEGGNDTVDKIFLLSENEVANEEYGFCGTHLYSSDASSKEIAMNETRIGQCDDYVTVIRRFQDETSVTHHSHQVWWGLRSPGKDGYSHGYVNISGFLEKDCVAVYGAQPIICALYLDLSADVWNYAGWGNDWYKKWYKNYLLRSEENEDSTADYSVKETGDSTVLSQQSAVISVQKPIVSRLKKGQKSFNIKWKKMRDVDGYELQYSLKKNFKSAKTKKVPASKASVAVKKLKAGKKYYVRMRAYKIVSGEKKYSGWSKVKTVKISK